MLLEIKNLRVKSADGKDILKGIDFAMERGEVQAILGPNGSGKSTFGQVIMGNPKFIKEKGSIFFQGKDIKRLSPEKRAKMGLAMSWQSPPSVKGVKFSQLLDKIKKNDFKMKEIKNISDREINVDLSGGEKKISELAQILSLDPQLVIFDEIDSGLDIKRSQAVAEIIKKELLNKKARVSLLLITHSGAILDLLKPDVTNIMVDGRIICKEKDYKKVLRVIKKYGYEKCRQCKLLPA